MAKRIAPSIYQIIKNGATYEIDGQNGINYGGNEWQVFFIIDGEYIWIETYPTKKVAIADILDNY